MRHLPWVVLLLALSCSELARALQCGGAVRREPPPIPRPAFSVSTPRALQPSQACTTYFDASRAWACLLKQVQFGPRVPGTAAHKACRRYLAAELAKSCSELREQQFSVKRGAGKLDMANIIGRIGVDQPRRVILAAHWDSRPTADYNPPGTRDQPIPGANDGASGVAILVELARVFHDHPPAVGVDIVLFDGEDYGPGMDMMLLGSKYFAKQLSDSQAASYNYGVLLDMVGDKTLDIYPEGNSDAVAGLVFGSAYEISRALGYRAFKQGGGITIEDDHLPLIARGVRMYDFIDFNYPVYPGTGTSYWHTTQDTPDKCSAHSLEAVGRTLENLVLLFPHMYEPEPEKR